MPRIETDDQGREYEYDDSGRCIRARIPTVLMDTGDPVQAAVARDSALPASYRQYVADHADALRQYGEIGAAATGNRYLAPSDQQRRQVADAHAEMVVRVSTAWQRPAEPADAEPAKPQRTGDADAAYQEYVSRVTGAWRRAA